MRPRRAARWWSALDIHNNAGGEGLDRRAPAAGRRGDSTSRRADALLVNLPRLAAAGINAVIGTTGWNAHEQRMQEVVAEADIGVVAAANFSLGVNAFQVIVDRARRSC